MRFCRNYLEREVVFSIVSLVLDVGTLYFSVVERVDLVVETDFRGVYR